MPDSAFEQMFADFTPFYLDQFGVNVTYRPVGNEANDKTIKAVMLTDGQKSNFGLGNDIEEFDIVECIISSRSNSEGHVSPTEHERENQTGDQIIHNGTTWRVREHLESDVAGCHRLLLATTDMPMLDGVG